MPFFEVMDQDGNIFNSGQLLGRKTIIYFYPKDNTSGCTAQACNLRDNYERLVAEGYNVIGISKDSALKFKDLVKQQHFTQPPARYTEESLIKTLEENGVGRPSTYAPTITTILARRYIVKENKNIYVTEIGEIVNQIMKNSFPNCAQFLKNLPLKAW